MSTNLISLPELPKEYIKALNLVRDACCENGVFVDADQGFIAGGALRDLCTGRVSECKDFDIFILGWNSTTLSEVGLERLSRIAEVIPGARILGNEECDQGTSASNKFVESDRIHIERPEGSANIDIVFLYPGYSSAMQVLDTFDIGLCKIAHNGIGYFIHQDFIRDLSKRCIRVCNHGAYGFDSIRDRVDRFSRYYPDFTTDTTWLDEHSEPNFD